MPAPTTHSLTSSFWKLGGGLSSLLEPVPAARPLGCGGPMTSQASRDAAKSKAVKAVMRLFGNKTSNASGKETMGVTSLTFTEPEIPGLSALHAAEPPDEVIGPSKRIYTSTSFCCLRPAHWPRRLAIQFIESWFFDPFILTTIMCNCVTMAWESPLDPPGTMKAAFIDVCEQAYLAIFTAELCFKMLAYGVAFHEHSYLRDSWCQLDFLVVTLAWIPIIVPSFGNYSVLRAFRALRPLRALKRVPGMPTLVQSILSALPRVTNVILLCAFIFLVFAIVGVETFKGQLHYRCALPGFVEEPGHPELVGLPEFRAAAGRALDAVRGRMLTDGRELAARALKGGGSRKADEHAQEAWDTGVACNPFEVPDACAALEGSPGAHCAYFEVNPVHGLMSFDNSGTAMISLVQAITFDDWTEVMYALMKSLSPWVVIYFISIVVIGGFFVVNLFLAVTPTPALTPNPSPNPQLTNPHPHLSPLTSHPRPRPRPRPHPGAPVTSRAPRAVHPPRRPRTRRQGGFVLRNVAHPTSHINHPTSDILHQTCTWQQAGRGSCARRGGR